MIYGSGILIQTRILSVEEEMVERFCHIQNHSPLTAYYYQVVYVQSDEDYRVEVHYLYSIHGKVMGRVYGDETGIRTGM